MAAKKLTPRQQEIKALTEQGKSAVQIAKKLGISDNGVYQHLRAIRGGKPAKKSGGSTTRSRSRGKAATGGRQSARKRTRTAASRPAPAPVVPSTAEELLTAEIQAANEAKTEALANIDSLEGQIEAAKLAIAGHDAEIATKSDVLDVLTGKKIARDKPKPTPARKKATGQSGAGKGAKAGSGAQGASQTGSNGSAASTPAPASQAEREATADHDGPDAPAAEKAATAAA